MNGNRYGQLAALLCAAALLLAGCGGGSDGINRDTHDTLQMDFDAAVAELAEVRGELTASEAEATRLEGELETSQAQAARLRVELATANGSVTSLTTDLSDANDEVTDLTTQLTTAQAEVTRLTTQIGSATDPTSLQGLLAAERARVTDLTSQLATATAEATSLRGQLTTAQSRLTTVQTALTAAEAQVTTLRTQVTTERNRATQAEIDAQEELAEELAEQRQELSAEARNLEANQRAQKLKEAFSPANRASDLTNIGLQITAPTQSSLRVMRGGHANGSISRIPNRSGSWIRSTTLNLVSGADDGKTVVYTDRELGRPLLEHFGQYRDALVPAQIDADQTGGPTLVNLGTAVTDITGGRATTSTGVSFSHSLRSSLGANDRTHEGLVNNNRYDSDGDMDVDMDDDYRGVATSRMLEAEDDSFSGSVHGVGGQFLCKTADCMITVTGTYNDNVPNAIDPDENDLASLTIASSDSALYFRPSSASSPLSLCDDRTRCTAGTDQQYMVFGYWREDPTSAAADYTVGVFAEAFNLGSPQAEGSPTATYDGIAVGMYVEQDPNDPVDTHRQGEFTADVDLRAVSGDVSGTIDDFVTTPTAGSAAPRTADRWVVRVQETAFDTVNGIEADTTAYIDNLTGVKSGSWSHTFVRTHANAADAIGTLNPVPRAVTGTFETKIEDFVQLLGAFGAEKR